MSVHFISSGRTKSSFELLYRKIAQDGDSFSFYESGMVLLRDLSSSFEYEPSLNVVSHAMILLDHALYKGFSDFIFDYLRLKNIRIPIVLVEPALPVNDKLSLRWISENEFQYDFPNLHVLYPILKKITEALNDEEIQKAFESSILSLEKNSILKRNLIENIQKQANFSPTVYNLLNFFYKNRRREISLSEIETHLQIESECPKTRKNAAYSYIARLRKCIGSTPSCSFEVLRTRVGHYRLLLY